MKKLAVIVAASAMLAAADTTSALWAQIPPGLGAADPSQQLKTSGMNTFQSQTSTFKRDDEKKEPLVSGTAEAAGDEKPAQATQTGTGAGGPPQTAPQQAPPAPAAAEAPPRPLPVLERAAQAPATTWNPAAAPATSTGAGGAALPTERMQRILDLVEQIKRKRDTKR